MNMLLAITALLAADAPGVLNFERERIGDVTFEAAGIFDVNKDKVPDIVSGAYWFEGPDFTTAHHIAEIKRVDDYYDDFSNYPLDVNGDGWLDIVTGGWWGKTLQWRENPGEVGGDWTTHNVLEVGNIERNCFYDLDGDGHVEVISTTRPVNIFQLERNARGKGQGTFKHYQLTEEAGGHGFGAGDVNGDGYVDLLFDGGWYEAPEDTFDMAAWKWHPAFRFVQGSVPILTHDVNGDGKMDLIVGQGHGFGLNWYEQTGDPTVFEGWTKHEIETDKSQFHEMQLEDIDNDGEVELVTGKRYRAHNGNDPGADEPLGLYYYEINGGDFVRNVIDYGPHDRASGTGLYMWIADVDGNGWKDIVAPGKEGLYLFRNQGNK